MRRVKDSEIEPVNQGGSSGSTFGRFKEAIIQKAPYSYVAIATIVLLFSWMVYTIVFDDYDENDFRGEISAVQKKDEKEIKEKEDEKATETKKDK